MYCIVVAELLVEIFVEGPGAPPFEFPRTPSKIWRVPPLNYITNSPILGVYWALRQNFTRAPLDFQGPGALTSEPPRALYSYHETSIEINIISWQYCIISSLILYHPMLLKHLRLLRFSLKQEKNICISHNQYHGCWWPGNVRSQGISSHGIDLLYLE